MKSTILRLAINDRNALNFEEFCALVGVKTTDGEADLSIVSIWCAYQVSRNAIQTAKLNCEE